MKLIKNEIIFAQKQPSCSPCKKASVKKKVQGGGQTMAMMVGQWQILVAIFFG